MQWLRRKRRSQTGLRAVEQSPSTLYNVALEVYRGIEASFDGLDLLCCEIGLYDDLRQSRRQGLDHLVAD
jgi:hypothetical protein